jgi:hypothetical protein
MPGRPDPAAQLDCRERISHEIPCQQDLLRARLLQRLLPDAIPSLEGGGVFAAARRVASAKRETLPSHYAFIFAHASCRGTVAAKLKV